MVNHAMTLGLPSRSGGVLVVLFVVFRQLLCVGVFEHVLLKKQKMLI